jgi:hypothetical protein
MESDKTITDRLLFYKQHLQSIWDTMRDPNAWNHEHAKQAYQSDHVPNMDKVDEVLAILQPPELTSPLTLTLSPQLKN